MKPTRPTATAPDFFATREGLIARVAQLDAELAASTDTADRLLAAGTATPDLTAKLSALNATQGSLSQQRDAAADALARHDKGLARAADALVHRIAAMRQACLQEVAATIREKAEWLFGPTEGLNAAELAEHESKLDALASHTIHLRAEHARHFPVMSFADLKSAPNFLAALPAYTRELDALGKRLAAIVEMRNGKRPLSHDLSEFVSVRAVAAKKVNPAFDPPESESAFKTRRAARLADYEARKQRALADKLNAREVDEMIGHLHPDRDPSFKRHLGSN